MADEAEWRRRFALFMAARLFGLAIFLAGVFIAFTDVVRDGGWPLVGGVLAVAGAIDAVFAPKMLRKMWAREDQERS